MPLIHPTRRRMVGLLLALVLALAGCTSAQPTPTPPPALPSADEAAKALATAISTGDFTDAPLATPPEDAAKDLTTILAGMDGVKPVVKVDAIMYVPKDKTATATLAYSWPVATTPWTYTVPAVLQYGADKMWSVPWSPALVHDQLSAPTRLVRTYEPSTRGLILDKDGKKLVKPTTVLKIGIDKNHVKTEQELKSARQLARLLAIDEEKYVAKVKKAGQREFVLALVVRQKNAPDGLQRIPGVLSIKDTMMLPLTKTFLSPLLGTTGPATAEILKKRKGKVVEGDIVGLSGLQARYDDELRGTGGVSIRLRQRSGTASASPSPAPGASASPSSSTGAASPGAEPVLYALDPKNGIDLTLSIDLAMQQAAEKILANRGPSAIAVVEPKTGRILAVANSPASSNAYATPGGEPPGSTMEVITSLALIREGYKPSTKVSCNKQQYTPGWNFENYDDYPGQYMGRITLKTAFAQSCNTAFVSTYKKLDATSLQKAAASLGAGVDYDAGFPVSYGSVPKTPTGFDIGQSVIGQGKVKMNAVTMAGVTASVAGGQSVVPYLVDGHQPETKGEPLTVQEGAYIREMMKEVVKTGTAVNMQGYVTGAKTGTAEYSATGTHAWMIAYTADYAIAVFVADGKHGNTDAGPVIQQFVRALR